MPKVIIDYSINRLIEEGRFTYERKSKTIELVNCIGRGNDIHIIAKQKVMELEKVTLNQIRVNACMTINT